MESGLPRGPPSTCEDQWAEGRYRSLKAGVPQGSVIAPLLFLMYVDDLPKKLQGEGVHTFLFADDLATSVEGNCVEECEKLAERVTTLVSEWAKDWRMQKRPRPPCSPPHPKKRTPS